MLKKEKNHLTVRFSDYTFIFKKCRMGTLFVLVSLCFRENVVIMCKIGSFLCSLDNLLQKNVIVFFLGNQF